MGREKLGLLLLEAFPYFPNLTLVADYIPLPQDKYRFDRPISKYGYKENQPHLDVIPCNMNRALGIGQEC